MQSPTLAEISSPLILSGMAKTTEPHVAILARRLHARLQLEIHLGHRYTPVTRLPEDAVLPAPLQAKETSAHPVTQSHAPAPQRPTAPASSSVVPPSSTSNAASSSVAFPLPEVPFATPTRARKDATEMSDREKALAPTLDEALVCKKCRLCEERTNVVFGEGDLNTDLVIVGEAPGRDEDIQGRPFVGRAGKLLTAIIEKGLKRPREAVYICNVVKCRPPGNRDPRADEKKACEAYLKKQLDIIRPKVIMAVGRHAANSLTGQDLPMGKLRGVWWEYDGIPLMPIYHTSYILRQRNEYASKNERCPADVKTWEDIKLIVEKLNQ